MIARCVRPKALRVSPPPFRSLAFDLAMAAKRQRAKKVAAEPLAAAAAEPLRRQSQSATAAAHM